MYNVKCVFLVLLVHYSIQLPSVDKTGIRNEKAINSRIGISSKSFLTPRICTCNRRYKRKAVDSRNSSSRIYGGNPTPAHAYPEMARVIFNGEPICGGTILNNYYILTAAHCIVSFDPVSYIVAVGTYNINFYEPYRQFLEVGSITVHPGFNEITFFNDIALLKLRAPIFFNEYVKPTCLPMNIKDYVDKAGLAIGWGRTENSFMSNVLQQVTMPLLPNSYCQQISKPYTILDSMICAGLEQGGRDSCQGDSGGPLFVWGTEYGMLVQLGITSFGFQCAAPGTAGVYTRTDYMMEFILRNVFNNYGCILYSTDI